MRIAVWHDLPGGGGKRALYEHVRGLVERGHEVVSFTPASRNPEYLPLSALVPEHVVPLAGGETARPRAPLARARHDLRALRAALAALEAHARQVAEAIAKEPFDLLFANTAVRFHAPPLGRAVRLPSVLYLQEPRRQLYEALPRSPWAAPPAPRRRRAAWRRQALAKRAADHVATWAKRVQVREEIGNAAAFDRLLVNSLYSRESVLRAYGIEASVSPLGVDAERFRPAPGPRGDFVIGMGTLYLGKGVDRAIEALATLPEDLRPRLLWTAPIVNPRFQAKMEALARRRGVRFEVRQGVPDDELVALLGTARCMLYAPRLEPLGLAPLEANACGTPVAAVAEGGVRETVVDGVNGRLAGDGRPAALGAALASLLRDDPAVWAERCRSHVIDRWGWKQAVDVLERHLREVAEGAP